MSQENPIANPTPFHGLRIFILDNDTSSLLDIAAKLEHHSYKVTTTEVPTVALSILQERVDQFDLVMFDINMPEMDCFKFIKSVLLIKDFPIILMSVELKKDVVEEAMTKGACFFLKKPISSKNLKNVWQHVYRKNKYETSRGEKAEIKQARTQGGSVREKETVLKIVDKEASRRPGNKQIGIGDGDENDHRGADEQRFTKSTEVCRKRYISPINDKAGEPKRKRTEVEGRLSEESSDSYKPVYRTSELDEFTDSTSFLELLQETDTIQGKESNLQTMLSMKEANEKQKMDLVEELLFLESRATSFDGEKK